MLCHLFLLKYRVDLPLGNCVLQFNHHALKLLETKFSLFLCVVLLEVLSKVVLHLLVKQHCHFYSKSDHLEGINLSIIRIIRLTLKSY